MQHDSQSNGASNRAWLRVQALRSYYPVWKMHFRLTETVQLACAPRDKLCEMP
jgi:hypothetical protein